MQNRKKVNKSIKINHNKEASFDKHQHFIKET